jgi:diadenosine tetraphosphate (Ap4A) HIT family hydrolase
MSRKECIFESQPDLIEDSTAPWDQVLSEDYHVRVFQDRYPCTEGHLLFVPRYNTFGVLTDAFEDAVRYGKKMVEMGVAVAVLLTVTTGYIIGSRKA